MHHETQISSPIGPLLVGQSMGGSLNGYSHVHSSGEESLFFAAR